MKLKKIAIALSLCATTLLSSVGVVNAAPNIYDVPTLSYEMTIPSGYYAMATDSEIDSDSIAGIVAAPGANFTTLLSHKIIVLDSNTLQPAGELLLTVAKSDFTSRVQNFLNVSEEYLYKEWTLALADKKYYKFDFYSHPEAKFVHTRTIYGTDMFENYATVKNGLYYMLSARNSGDYTEYTASPILKQIVDSIHFTSHDVIVLLNGQGLEFSQRPMIYKDKTMVPLRVIFEAMGAEVDWDNDTKTVTATNGATTISLQINNPIMTKNGEEITLEAPALLYNDHTLVPARAVAEAFGATVDWDGAARIVKITY